MSDLSALGDGQAAEPRGPHLEAGVETSAICRLVPALDVLVTAGEYEELHQPWFQPRPRLEEGLR